MHADDDSYRLEVEGGHLYLRPGLATRARRAGASGRMALRSSTSFSVPDSVGCAVAGAASLPSAACLSLYTALGDEEVGEALGTLVAKGQGGATVALAGIMAK